MIAIALYLATLSGEMYWPAAVTIVILLLSLYIITLPKNLWIGLLCSSGSVLVFSLLIENSIPNASLDTGMLSFAETLIKVVDSGFVFTIPIYAHKARLQGVWCEPRSIVGTLSQRFENRREEATQAKTLSNSK